MAKRTFKVWVCMTQRVPRRFRDFFLNANPRLLTVFKDGKQPAGDFVSATITLDAKPKRRPPSRPRR